MRPPYWFQQWYTQQHMPLTGCRKVYTVYTCLENQAHPQATAVCNNDFNTYCIQGSIRPLFIFAPFAFVVSGRIYDWTNSKSQIIPFKQNCLSEFKTGQNLLQVKKGEYFTGRKITLFIIHFHLKNSPLPKRFIQVDFVIRILGIIHKT